MTTSYDILGVPRSAPDEAIRAAFHNAAKACHPDVNAGDSAAERKLKQISAAYDDLKSPERRKAYDQLLNDRRRAKARRFATSTGASLAGGGVVVLGVWLLGSPPHQQVASAPAASLSPAEWERVEASRDAIAPPSHPDASDTIKAVAREESQEPLSVPTRAAVREELPAQNPETVTTKLAIHEQQELEGDPKSGHAESAARKPTLTSAARRPSKGHDPVRQVTAEIRSPALFGVGF